MLHFMISAFVVLHGLVHLLYFGQSQRFFELQPKLIWPDGSWAFSRLFGNDVARSLASFSLGLVALGFVIGGSGILLWQGWWRPVVIGSALFSAAIFLLFWDGGMQRLDDKGAIGLLINLAILIAVLMFS